MDVKFIGFVGFNATSASETTSAAWIGDTIDFDYVHEASKLHEDYGFDRVLIPFSSDSPESQLMAAYIASRTTRLGFLVAHRPGFTQPTLAARQFATLDQTTNGRVAVHIITGAADAEMARDGDVDSNKADRYARSDEYLTVMRRQWTDTKPHDHDGRFFHARRAFSVVKPKNLPVFFGGSSDEAMDVAGKHADVYAFWGEPPHMVQETLDRVRASAARHGRTTKFSMSLRPVVADTEEAAWKRATDIEDQVRAIRQAAGLPTTGHKPAGAGGQRLMQAAAEKPHNRHYWTGVAALTGATGNSTGFVGTAEQVADAMMEYYDLGIDHFLIRGFDPIYDTHRYGKELLPAVRARVAQRARQGVALAS